MNYELAKKLKDAGFPKDKWCPKVDDEECHLVSCRGIKENPTLSELIEACGEVFYGVFRAGDDWKATAANFILMGDRIISSVAKTPEEAVAYLYLELHKNG